MRVVKYCQKPPVSVVTGPPVNAFKKSLDKSLSPSHPLTEHSSPHFSPRPHLHTTHYQLSSQCVTHAPVLYLWFLQARCGLLTTIMNHSQVLSPPKTLSLAANPQKPLYASEFQWRLNTSLFGAATSTNALWIVLFIKLSCTSLKPANISTTIL